MANSMIEINRISPNLKILRFGHIVPSMVAFAAISLLIIRSLVVADSSWDTLAYHLPFSALNAGLITSANYVLPDHLAASYLGFPSAIYFLKGLLWSATGRAESAQILSVLSIVVFVFFAVRTLNLPVAWLIIGILAIPTVQIGASGNMTDVPANMGLAMMFVCLYKLAVHPNQIGRRDLVWLSVACLIASGSKPQAVVVGTSLFVGYTLLFFATFYGRGAKEGDLTAKKSAIVWLGVSAVAVSYPALANTYLYGNPIYPMQLNIGGIHLPGVFSSNNWSDPAYLRTFPQPVRWLLSVLELHAFDLRPIPYTVDQGSVPHTALSFRMGGYFAPLMVMSGFVILLFATMQSRRKEFVRGVVLLASVTFFIASLPGSHELRYYSFWAISLVTIALHQVSSAESDPFYRGISLSYKAFLIICFSFIAFITGGAYFNWQGSSYEELAKHFPRTKISMHTGNTTLHCFAEDYRGAIFDSAAFSDSANVVAISPRKEKCGKENE